MSATPTLVELTRTLIAAPSISSTVPAFDMSNRAVCEIMANWLQPLGFACELRPIAADSDKCNLIATLGRGDGGLVLAGHADTVPYDDTGWESDPFALTERDERWYGLGTSDMKGFLALCVELAGELQGRALKQPLVLLATADEESGMDGARALVASGQKLGRHALIGEPTGLHPVRMHKGIFMEAVRVGGHAGHSSNPALGINAIEGMHLVLGEVLAFRDELAGRERRAEFPVPYATLNTGCVHGGDSPNRIPAQCELQLDLRMLPGSDIGELRGELRERLRQRLGNTAWQLDFRVLFDGADPFETAAQSEIVMVTEALTGSPARAVDFATEGGMFNQLGMNTIVLGPGDIEQAHQPNEFLGLERIDPMRRILRRMVQHFCVEDRHD